LHRDFGIAHRPAARVLHFQQIALAHVDRPVLDPRAVPEREVGAEVGVVVDHAGGDDCPRLRQLGVVARREGGLRCGHRRGRRRRHGPAGGSSSRCFAAQAGVGVGTRFGGARVRRGLCQFVPQHGTARLPDLGSARYLAGRDGTRAIHGRRRLEVRRIARRGGDRREHGERRLRLGLGPHRRVRAGAGRDQQQFDAKQRSGAAGRAEVLHGHSWLDVAVKRRWLVGGVKYFAPV
jgi:hypothetical protein